MGNGKQMRKASVKANAKTKVMDDSGQTFSDLEEKNEEQTNIVCDYYAD